MIYGYCRISTSKQNIERQIYVNGAYDNKDDTSDLAKLIHDFRCKKADEMVLNP